MNPWSIIAICLVAPALLFLLAAAVVSGLRMPREVVRSLLLAGLALLPVAVVCVWLRDQPWLGPPWDFIVNLGGTAAGFIVFYAVIVGFAVAARNVLGLTTDCS